jgi:hypothetical protein
LRGRRPDVAPELEAIVSRCLSKHPSDRYAHAGELAMALSDLRMRGLVRSERGAERAAVATEVSMNRQRLVRETAETEGDPSQSQPGAMRGLLADAQLPPSSQPKSGGGKLLPIIMIVITICILVGLVLALQGRLSSPGRGEDDSSKPTKSAVAAAASTPPSSSSSSSSSIPPPSVLSASSSAAAVAANSAKPAASAGAGGRRRARFISARNTGDRAWRAWIDRHRPRLEGCTAQQTCPINVNIRITKSESRAQGAAASSDGCTLHGSMSDCLNESLREPGVPSPDVCTPDDCHADVQIMFD